MAKIFISYKRKVEPDTSVATAVYEALRHNHEVFIDTTIQIGEKWGETIQRAIKDADFLICFLSQTSVHSEMVIAEIETAYHHGKELGKPAILPVRLDYSDSLGYPLSAYLNPLQWALWAKDVDTPLLIDELKQAVSGGELSAKNPEAIVIVNESKKEEFPTAFADIPRDLSSAEGTMPKQSRFYIERKADHVALNTLNSGVGVTITIKGPRQMGKSSLLNRLLSEAKAINMRTAFIDFQLIENTAIEDPSVFYRQFCSLLSWEFEIEDFTEKYWDFPLGNIQRTTNYLQRHILKELKDVQVLIAMDEVDRMFSSPFRSDFFSMLRSWHNNRARGGDWTRLNIALVTSTEPYQLIADLNQSPFNVGEVVDLVDFKIEEVFELNRWHQSPLGEAQVQQLFDLLAGHPYLTRRALFLISSQRTTFSELMKDACEDEGPFGDHLRNHLFRMSDQDKLSAALMQVIKHHQCSNEQIFFRLRGAGLVRRVANVVIPRNQLYETYFKSRLNG
jgi:hypothetical protein